MRLSFCGTEPIPDFITYLPIPKDAQEDKGKQDARKALLAEYLVAQIYNYGITRRVFETKCPPLAAAVSKRTLGMVDNESLSRLILETETRLRVPERV